MNLIVRGGPVSKGQRWPVVLGVAIAVAGAIVLWFGGKFAPLGMVLVVLGFLAITAYRALPWVRYVVEFLSGSRSTPRDADGLPLGRARVPSVKMLRLPGTETILDHGQHRGMKYAVFSYELSLPVALKQDDTNRTRHTFHVAYVEAGATLPVMHLASRAGPMPLDPRLIHEVTTESAQLGADYQIWAKDARAAHALLAPTVIAAVLDAPVAPEWWVVDTEVVAAVTTAPLSEDQASRVVESLCAVVTEIPEFIRAR